MDNELREAVEFFRLHISKEFDSHTNTVLSCCERVLDAEEDVDLEKMAEIEHTRWSGWQEYLHSKCIKNEDGSLTIPSGYVENLVRLINTPYDKLTEKEKESDRAEAKNSIDQAAIVIAKNYRRVSELPTEEKIIECLTNLTDKPSDFIKYGLVSDGQVRNLAKVIHEMIGGE